MNPTPTPNFIDLTNDIYLVMREHLHDARFSYLVDLHAAVMKSRRVTRLDLFELINAVTDCSRIPDPSRHFDLNARIAYSNILRVYESMDRAAVYTSLDFPLVIDLDDPNSDDNFSLRYGDDYATRERKLARQTPAASPYLEYIAR
jgi:hypothetical protein